MITLKKGDQCAFNIQINIDVSSDCRYVISDNDIEFMKGLIRSYLLTHCKREFLFDDGKAR